MDKKNYIHQHYKKTAKNFGLSERCTIQDPIIREKELQFLKFEILNFIKTHERMPIVMDIGCGNGYAIEKLSAQFPDAHFIGLEPHPDLFQLCLKRKENLENKRIQFFQKSILQNSLSQFSVDIIYTERVLINLINEKEQEKAINQISKHLTPGGEYLMIESFVEPLQRINQIRRENQLGGAIEVSDHNEYLKFSFLRKLSKYQMFPSSISMLDALTPHFFLSRVFHPLTRQEGSKMKENALIDVLESSGQFQGMKSQFLSPIQFLKFKKSL